MRRAARRVAAFHAGALGAGGRDNGKPGLRADYGPNYYAAFVVDPDGYRLEAYCGAEAEMATIRKEMTLRANPAQVWDAVRDVGAIHTRLAPDFVTDVKLEGGARIVTFANGKVAKELIVDRRRRGVPPGLVGGRGTA